MTKRCWLALFLSVGFFPGVGQAADSLTAILRDIPVDATLPVSVKILSKDFSYPEGDFSGKIIRTYNGRGLYACDTDQKGISTCTGECNTTWPAYVVTSPTGISTGQDADQTKVDHFQIPDAPGVYQVEYGDHPLYEFSGDEDQGGVNGHCQTGNGCTLHVVAVDGSLVPCASGGTSESPGESPGEGGGWSGGSCGSEGCTGCQGSSGGYCDSSCGDTWVCGWDPGYECLNNHNHQSKCCKYTGNSQCKGDGSSSSGGGGGSCGTREVCGWTPGWRCWDNHQGRSSCCWNAHDSSCHGY